MQTTEQISNHMAELLSSEQFSTSPRLADLLSFCVNAALTGNEDSLKETLIGINVFGRTPDYDPKIDPIVRVNVRRLRQKLDVFYRDRNEPQDIRILFPKGTYIPAFEIRDLPQTIAPKPEVVSPLLPEEVPSFPLVVDDQKFASKATKSILSLSILVALIVLLLIATALVRYLHVVHLRGDASSSRVSENTAAGLLRPLTSLPGRKSDPQLSPDQRTLAFLWDANRSGALRVYLQQTGDLSPIPLTRTNTPEVRFVWSKDGGSIAILRMVEPYRYELLLVDLSTRREQVIHTFEFNYTIERPALDMSPDGRWFVVGEQTAAQPIHLVLVNATDGSHKQVTDPPDGSTGDVEAKFSPDGKSIAFRRGQLGELYLTSVANQGIHTPARLTFSNPGVRGISWSPDGKAIYFGSIDGGKEPSIWRYDRLTREMKMVTPAGLAAVSPAVSSDGKNLIFTTSVPQMTFRLYDIHSHRPSEPFESVQAVQTNPSVSPDGKTVAYTSDAGGTMELWSVSETDRIPRKLTSFNGAGIPFFPSWSPDSKKIIFFYRERGLNYD
jgi:Tol biopolymer transport system component